MTRSSSTRARATSGGRYAALGQGGSPLGTVEKVEAGSSRITLFSAPGRETSGWVGEARTPVTFTGAGAGVMNATVPKDALVQVGDIAYLPGPGALAFGVVARVDSNPSSPESQVRVQPTINPFSVLWVQIVPARVSMMPVAAILLALLSPFVFPWALRARTGGPW